MEVVRKKFYTLSASHAPAITDDAEEVHIHFKEGVTKRAHLKGVEKGETVKKLVLVGKFALDALPPNLEEFVAEDCYVPDRHILDSKIKRFTARSTGVIPPLCTHLTLHDYTDSLSPETSLQFLKSLSINGRFFMVRQSRITIFASFPSLKKIKFSQCMIEIGCFDEVLGKFDITLSDCKMEDEEYQYVAMLDADVVIESRSNMRVKRKKTDEREQKIIKYLTERKEDLRSLVEAVRGILEPPVFSRASSMNIDM